MTLRGLLLIGRWVSAFVFLAVLVVLALALRLAATESARGDLLIGLQGRMDALSALADDLALDGASAQDLDAFSAEAAALRRDIAALDGPTDLADLAAATVTDLERLLLDMAGPDGTLPDASTLGPADLRRLATLADAGQVLDAAVLELLHDGKRTILARSTAAALGILGLGLGMLGFAIFLLRWLDRRVVTPVAGMTAVVERIGAGDLSARAADTGLRELALLARHINDMAAGRADVEDGLRRALQRVETLNATLCRSQTIGRLGAWYADLRHGVLTWDDQTCAIFGLDPAEAPGTPDAFFALVDPRDRAVVANVQNQQVEAGQVVDYQHRILTPHGIRWVWERAEILRDAAGMPVALDGTVQDITQLKETEIELEQARETAAQRAALLRIAGRTARFGGWRYSVAEERLDWTPETARIYDLSPDLRPTVKRLLAKCDPSDRDRLRDCLTASVEEGRNFNDVFRQTTSTGRPIWTRITAEVVRDAEGRIVEVQGACQDITDLIAARSEVDRRNAELEGVVLSMQDGFIMLDDSGTIQFLNKRARDILGLGRSLRVGADLLGRLAASPAGSMKGQLRDALLRQENCLALLVDPEVGTAVETAIQIVGNRRIVLARDVTRERLVQRRLLLLDAALEKIDDIVLITEVVAHGGKPELRMLYANSAFERITGRDRTGIVGLAPRTRFPEETEDQIAALERLEQAARDGRAVSVELVTHRTDGAPVWLQVQTVPLSDPESGRDYIVSIERDITEDKAREDRAFHMAKMEAIGQLTGGVAHDFNNLLTVILGNADMLHDSVEDEDARRRIEAMIAAAERGALLTDSMLAFSRRTPLRPTRTDVNQLIAQSLSLLRKAVPEDIRIEMTLGADHPAADVDAARLQAALVNLVLNSRDAIRRNGLITLSTSNLEIAPADMVSLPVDRPGRYLLVSVSDDGEGIAADVLPKVFEPFFTTKPAGAGTGLGLSTVYGFARQSGGHVAVTSEPGLGTTVRLYLPCAQEATETEPRPPAEREDLPPGQGERVLVVEDDPALLAFALRQLAALGYVVTPAADAEAALAILQDGGRPFDLLFSDVVLPGALNGSELASRAVALRPGLKVLFTSGYTRSALDRQGRIAPDVHLLSKPYRLAELARSLRSALSA